MKRRKRKRKRGAGIAKKISTGRQARILLPNRISSTGKRPKPKTKMKMRAKFER